MIRSALVLFVAWCLLACPQAPVSPPVDASDASPSALGEGGPMVPCQAACARLALLGCAEGTSPVCYTTLSHADGSHKERKPDGHPLTCADVADARTVADVRALGQPCIGAP